MPFNNPPNLLFNDLPAGVLSPSDPGFVPTSGLPSLSAFGAYILANLGTSQNYAVWLPPKPSQTTQITTNPRTLSVQYGDGYESSIPDGINYQPVAFDLVFTNRRTEVVLAVQQFFQGTPPFFPRLPSDWFWFYIPSPYQFMNVNGNPLKFRHGKISTDFSEGMAYTLKVSLRQVFDP